MIRPFTILILFIIPSTTFADVGSLMRKGNALYKKGKFEQAQKSYQSAMVIEPDNPRIHYNMANTLYRLKKYDEAIDEYQLGLLSKDKKFKARTLYNIGNCQFKKGALDAAIESYKASLLLNPLDRDAKENLELCIRLKEQLKKNPQSDSLKNRPKKKESQKKSSQPEPQMKKGQFDRQQLEQLLQALKNKEKKNLKKARQAKKKKYVEKDW